MANQTARAIPCVVCHVNVDVETYSSPHAEAPAMFSVPAGAAFGIAWRPGEGPRLIVTCGDRCLRDFLSGGPHPPRD